jgi:hypothetical protein
MSSGTAYWRSALRHLPGILAVLGLVAWLAPPPSPTDQGMMERVGQGVIVPGCADLNCFRILVPAAVETFPGPSLPRWRVYAVVANAGAAIAAGRLAVGLGLTPAASMLTVWLSALGAGSLSTIYHPYNADPLVLFFAPVITLLLLQRRTWTAGVLSTVGIFAKEFAAAPLYIAAAASALKREWPLFRRHALLAAVVTAVWASLQLVLMTAFGYSYNNNPSSRPLEGGYLMFWFRHVGPVTAALGLFGTFGALNLLIPFGWKLAAPDLRALSIGAIPALLAFMYVATPERALWNFFFLAVPLAAIVLAALPATLSWLFVACYGAANLRIGGQLPNVPASRYAIALTLLIGAVAIVRALRAPVAAASVPAMTMP